jgi:hypothetical protein
VSAGGGCPGSPVRADRPQDLNGSWESCRPALALPAAPGSLETVPVERRAGIEGNRIMGKAWMVMVAAVLGGHGLVGLFIEGSHMLGVLNVDFFVDVLYLGSAVALLLAGTRPIGPGAIRGTLAAFGGLFTLMGVLSIFDNELGGLTPTGFTIVDDFLFFGIGLSGLALAMTPSSVEPLTTGGKALN